MSINDEKQAIREKVWRLLERAEVVPPGSFGKIPSFKGADRTAEALAGLSLWREARVIKANPDHPQLPVRVRALRDGKVLYMAVPRMASLQPFFLLDPESIEMPFEQAAQKIGAAKIDRRVGVEEMKHVDLVICGSVAVNRTGARIGKGAGYSDLEVALLVQAGLVTDKTVIIAPVHDLQLIDDEIPESEHDFKVDLIVTPDQIIPCTSPHRPQGIIWDDLTPDMVKAIPILAAHGRLKYDHASEQIEDAC